MEYTDQLDRRIHLDHPPRRIVSLVPSQTELLVDLGLEEELVGITKFCVHPKRVHRSKQRVGGTKDIKLDIVRDLQPDLIIANKEENPKAAVEALAEDFPVWVSDVQDFASALQMIRDLGHICRRDTQARALCARIQEAFEALPVPAAGRCPRVAYLIWKDPYMVAGGDTFIGKLLERLGLDSVFAEKRRYPAIELEELSKRGVTHVLLSSEPYPFREKHIRPIHSKVPQSTVLLVDGEFFSWYGSRLQYAPPYFEQLLADFFVSPR